MTENTQSQIRSNLNLKSLAKYQQGKQWNFEKSFICTLEGNGITYAGFFFQIERQNENDNV